MRKRFGDTQDPSTADRVAKACLVLPEAADGVELAYQLADRAAALGKDHPWTYWFLFGKGLADYRRGNIRAAVQELDALTPRIPPSLPELNACRHLVQAMALHRQGDAKAAREHLAAGAKLLDRHVHDPTRFPTLGDKLGEGSAYNQDWLIAWLLHREAQTLIEGTKAGPTK
jgi:hypothetical protein